MIEKPTEYAVDKHRLNLVLLVPVNYANYVIEVQFLLSFWTLATNFRFSSIVASKVTKVKTRIDFWSLNDDLLRTGWISTFKVNLLNLCGLCLSPN